MAFANGVVARAPEDNNSAGGWIGFSVFGIALSAVLLLVVVPRMPGGHAPVAVLGFGIGAVVTCLLWWSALPFALGVAAIAAARRARTASAAPSPRRSPPASLGALAIARRVPVQRRRLSCASRGRRRA